MGIDFLSPRSRRITLKARGFAELRNVIAEMEALLDVPKSKTTRAKMLREM